jgi:hypothetical protein
VQAFYFSIGAMRSLLIISSVLLMGLVSCRDSSLTRTLPNVSGSTGDVMVVIDKALWNGAAGKALREEVAPVLIGLPQQEPAFDLQPVNPDGFRDILISHRNIIIMAIDGNRTEPEVTYERNRWAESQLVIRVTAPDTASLAGCISKNAEAIRQRINDAERQRLTAWLTESAGKEKSIASSGESSYEIIMPAGYRRDFTREGLLIISAETQATTQSVIISVSEGPSPRIGCIELADLTEKVTSGAIKGPDGGSFMVIEKQTTVSCRSFRRNEIDYIEMRGLWTLEGGFMGGPFISYAFIDPETLRTVTVIGFVYAPREEKRELLRQVEALMYTVRKAS